MDRPVTVEQLPAAGQSLASFIAGGAGRIETLIAAPRTPLPPRGFAVICHPHPLYGGAMSNKVTYTLASIALQAGLYAVRFNFRGVGNSEGVHDHARGETADTLKVIEWMRQRLPAQSPLLLAGFSFGSFVSLKAAEQARPALQVTIAPPFGKYFAGESPPARPDCPWIAVHSTDDDTVAYDDTVAVLNQYQPPPTLVTMHTAGHFFHGQLVELQQAVLPFVQQHWPQDSP